MKQQINSPFSCHHRKFATPHSPANPSRFENLTAKSGICCSLSFTRLSFRMRRRLKFFNGHFRNFRGFFPEIWRRYAGRNQESRPCGFGIKNQARCAARNQESRPLRGPESRIKNHRRGLIRVQAAVLFGCLSTDRILYMRIARKLRIAVQKFPRLAGAALFIGFSVLIYLWRFWAVGTNQPRHRCRRYT